MAQNEALAADKSAILHFVHSHFKGKIWQNHLVNQDRLFTNFVSDGTYLVDENGIPIHLRFQEIGLKALGKWDAYKNFQIESDRLKETNDYPDIPCWEEQENLMKNIPINDANFALFSKGVDDCLVRYHQLMLLPANRKTYNFD